MSPKFEKGDEVQSISDPSKTGTIVEVCEVHAGDQWYRVNFGSRDRPKRCELDLRPLEISAKPAENLKYGVIDGYREFQRLLTYYRLIREHPLKNNIYAYNASRTRFYPYQFKPLLKFLNSPKKSLLIADEVGLGKTIEACLILTELRARQHLDRVLVVCPAKLTEKWQFELKRRFGEEFRILNCRDFRKFLKNFEQNPYGRSLKGIISLESIRQEDIIESLKDLRPSFQLVIVDEAHHMRNFGTNSRKLGKQLGELAEALLFLTATPIHLGNENLFSLLNILDEEAFPDSSTAELLFQENESIVKAQTCMAQIPPQVDKTLKFLKESKRSRWLKDNPLVDEAEKKLYKLKNSDTDEPNRDVIIEAQRDISELNLLGNTFSRTRKREVHTDFPIRKPKSIKVNLTDKEYEFYQAVTHFVRLESEKKFDLAGLSKLMLIMPQRRVSSSIPAMVNYYRSKEGFDFSDFSEDMDPVEFNFEPEEYPAVPKTVEQARKKLISIVNSWPEDADDSKYISLLKILKKLRKKEGRFKILIFAFFKDTLRYLSKRLSKDGFENRMIHGDVPASKRPERIEEFQNESEVEVLLSSKVGGEGLDFQFCDSLVNYDLPWNPMQVEQRIGRLDRIGQKSDVIRIFNLWVEDTIEQRMLKRLYKRIGIFKKSIGELEGILGEIMGSIRKDILSKNLTPKEEERLLEQKLRAVEKRKADTKKLESESAKFIGTDQFFNKQMKIIQKRRRFVTSQQLRRFIIDFIKTNCPRTRLSYNKGSKRGKLYPDGEFISILQRYTDPGDLTRFAADGDRGVAVTFDSQVAFEEPEIEFINVLHPITRGITNFHKEEQSFSSNAHHVVLDTKELPSDFYFYFVYRLRVTAAREENTLETVILDQNFKKACNNSEAEIILGEMIERGEDSIEGGIEFEPDHAEKACKKAESYFCERVFTIREEAEANNARFIDRRLESHKTHYKRIINKTKKRLLDAERESKAENYIRMQRGIIDRYESELQEKIRHLEERRRVVVDYDEVSAGVLEVSDRT